MQVLNQAKVDRLSNEIGRENVPILLDIFLGELAQYIERLTTVSEGQGAYIQDISHALKSSAASFGAEALCALAIDFDAAAKAGASLNDEETRQKMIALLKETQQRYHHLLSQ
ncbi:quorum-sensing phosphorelay protein LuxU [Vibrio renipiscarius]|uniref:Phosphorelay protein LuxU n=1 Tax=Vibrio renipiscarius TaxID=1461322 RepID=A0A0C2NY70_9VIBR|nr:quorum-sensing phosphorelay protein LuxU [Vibrio renipiscarius]KII78635.1 phosphorelay protein LuxU [Vibrio renipiscarius]KII81060.1 phosphorelay protein LuxU [Vibrio renipiscarius]